MLGVKWALTTDIELAVPSGVMLDVKRALMTVLL